MSPLIALFFVVASPICDKAVALDAGQVAQCKGGILLPSKWAQKCALQKSVTIPRLKNDLELLVRTSTAHVRKLKNELETERNFSAQQGALLKKTLQHIGPGEWWTHTGVWMGIGFIAGASATIATTYAVNSR